MGEYLEQRLRELQKSFPLIGNIAGKGLHLGVDLGAGCYNKGRATTEAEGVMV